MFCHASRLAGILSRAASTGLAKNHSKFNVVFEMFGGYISRRRPYGVLVGEVAEFTRRERGAGPNDLTPLKRLLELLSKNGYFAQACLLDVAVWIEQSRPRVCVIA